MNVNAKTWMRIEEIFHQALAYSAPERAAFLDRACGEDRGLREEIESLLLSDELPGEFLEEGQLTAGLNLYAAADSQTLAGEHIGHFTLERRLARGGMGDVYLARDENLGRFVALKLLPPSFGGDAEWVARFRQEARAASSITHPNIAHIYEVGEFEGRHYIAMEYIEGATLRDKLRLGALPPEQAIEIATQVARGLAAAHAVGVLHRDVKPENIMIRPDDFVKILDFGISKVVAKPHTAIPHDSLPSQNVTDPGTMLGTVRYMSPEQARRESLDERTDVWSLGVTLYEMLSGRPPFEGTNANETLAAILSREPEKVRLGGSAEEQQLQEIVDKALQKQPGGRYLSIQAFAEDLKAARLALTHTAESNAKKLRPRLNDLWSSRSRHTRRNFLVAAVTLIFVIAALLLARYFINRKSEFHPDPKNLVYVFYYEYEDDIDPGNRYFYRSPDGYWVEREDNGHENIFKEIGPGSTAETKGLLLRNIKTTLELVIPEKQGASRKLFFRVPPVQRWRYLGDIIYPDDSPTP